MYRVFLVGRGYGGAGKSRSSRRSARHAARPDFLAWQRLQQALFNISGPSFRILLDIDDPLDLVADRSGWQCFMLYYLAFTDEDRDPQGWTQIDRLNNKLEGSWGAGLEDEEEAKTACQQELEKAYTKWRRHWKAFEQAVAECHRLPNGFVGLLEEDWRPTVADAPLEDPDEDLTRLTANQAFNRLPVYLRWNPRLYETLPVWEKFFVVTLRPEGEQQGELVQHVRSSISAPLFVSDM